MSKTPIRKPDAFDVILETFISGKSLGQAIERQEKDGQESLINSDTLPKDCPKEQLEKLGFVFREDCDDLFVYVTFPAGWKKVATSHSMWSELVDDKGRVRGSIGYKAAFYDRWARMYIVHRFAVFIEKVGGWRMPNETTPLIVFVQDRATGSIIWQSEPATPSDENPWYNLSDMLRPKAQQWLSEHYPDWEDELAYWD